jgi:branched-chain amino acid transport system permease protein
MIPARRFRRMRSLRLLLILAGLIAIACVPLVVTDRYLLRIFTLVGINVVVIAGLALLFGYTGQISLGHAAFVGLGAYGSAYVSMAGWPWPVALIFGVVLASLGGLVLAMPSLRLKGHYLAMATLGFGEIMFVFFDNAEWFTGGSDGLQGIPPASIGGLSVTTPEANYWLVWGFACLSLILTANVVGLRPGRALRAIHGSELGASACGIDTVRLKIQVFVISAALAGLAGVLTAHYIGSLSPSSFTLHRSVVFVAMVAVGGSSSLAGPVGAAVLLTMLPYLDAIIPGLPRSASALLQDWESEIYGMVLILFMPHGIAGVFAAAARRLGLKDEATDPAVEEVGAS